MPTHASVTFLSAAGLLAALLLPAPPAGARTDGPIDWRPLPDNRSTLPNQAVSQTGPLPLQCTGTEPFWSLSLSGAQAVMEEPAFRQQADRTQWRTGAVQPVANRSDRWVVPLLAETGRDGQPDGFAVLLATESCVSAAGETLPYDIVLVGAGRQPLSGCCQAAMAPAEQAAVTVSPGRAAPGEPVTVSASGFPPYADVVVGAGPANAEYVPLLPARTDAEGAVSAEVPLPQAAGRHDRYVFAVRLADGSLDAVSEPVAVTPPAEGRPRNAGDGLRITGTLTGEGVECQALRGDDGRLYTLAGAALEGLENGDRVTVTGERAELSFCMQGTTINVADISPGG